MPIRGHSGVQGTAECGADADKLPGADRHHRRDRARDSRRSWGHPIPHRRGLRARAPARARRPRRARRPLSRRRQPPRTMPDPRTRDEPLENVRIRIHQDIVLNTSTLLDAKEAVRRAARRDALRAALGRHLDLDRAAHPLHARDPAARGSPRRKPSGRSRRSIGRRLRPRQARPFRPPRPGRRSATRWPA